MRKTAAVVLATMGGAGLTCGAIILASAPPGGRFSGGGQGQPTISSEAGVAWQVFRHADVPAPAAQQPNTPAPVTQQNAPAPAPVAVAPPRPKPPETFAPAQVFVASPHRPLPRSATAEPVVADAASLTRALQRELKRVGCYYGEINGVWTPPTRHASEAFLALANARLPVTGPDPALLALVKASTSTSCAAGCQQGRMINGVCRDETVASASPPAKIGAPTPTPQAAPASTLFEQPPMALKGPIATETEIKGDLKTLEAGNAVQGPAVDAKTSKARPPAQQRQAYRPRNDDWRMRVWRSGVN
jgi:hypothetical protein